jgi:colicin import membrane protein
MHVSLKSLTIPRDALRPPSSDNPRVGALMSLLAHIGLIVALTLGVQWHTVEPEGVTAELWASVPEIAAPRAEPPPPAPEISPPPQPAPAPPVPTAAERDADIALEQAKRERLDKQQREADAQRARDKRLQEAREERERDAKAQADKDKLAKQQADAKQRDNEKAAATAREKARQDQLRRMNDQLDGTGAPGSTGTAARDAGPTSSYAGRIVARIRPNIQLPFEVPGNPVTEVELRVAPDGTILSQRVVKPSGVKEWDDAVLRAVEKTAVLPRDDNGRVFSPMTLSVSRYPKT